MMDFPLNHGMLADVCPDLAGLLAGGGVGSFPKPIGGPADLWLETMEFIANYEPTTRQQTTLVP